MKRALITGVTGQDGAWLSGQLLKKGYEVYGAYRRLSTPNFWRLQHLDIFDKINLVPVDLSDTTSIFECIKTVEPNEVYHLAAQSFVGASFEQPLSTGDITGLAVTRFLEAIRQINSDIKFYQASTSELFGNTKKSGELNEEDMFMPRSPYSAAKLYGYWITRIYRDAYGIFAVNGILFNHESEIRGMEFVTRKISNAVAKIAHGLQKDVKLGNLDAKRDWGYAPEYTLSMISMLNEKEADDYVVATGEAHTIREFCEKAFDMAGLDWHEYVKVDKRFLRPIDVNYLCGDPSKAKEKLNWKPKIKFDKLVEIMVKADLERWEKWLSGERFPWDAPNYPNEDKILTRGLKV